MEAVIMGDYEWDENINIRNRSGYLTEDFHFFHLKDRVSKEFEFHYHDFDKIIIFISGKVTYFIEGKAYFLKPWDMLLVNNNEIHKPIIDSSEVYERIIIWTNLEFIERHNYEGCDLRSCFNLVNEKRVNLIRLDEEAQNHLKTIIRFLEDAIYSKEFGSKLLSNALFIELLIYINRIYLGNLYIKDGRALKYDKQIEEILKFINSNLSEDLSIDTIAEKFYLSRYYLMHKFKKETGYTIHNYILQKRLILVIEKLENEKEITKVSLECGFNDYSAFLRAFKKMFNKSPREYISNKEKLNGYKL